MLESLLPLEQAYAAVLDMEVPKPPPLRPSIGTPDTVTVAVTFTPHWSRPTLPFWTWRCRSLLPCVHPLVRRTQ